MKPYYDDGRGIVIYHGDCTEIFPTLRGDAMITDPPYGIGFKGGEWDDDPKKYPEMMCWLTGVASRSIAGWCFVFQAMPNCGEWHRWFPAGFRIFAACKNFAQIRPTGVWHSWDPVIFWTNGERKKTVVLEHFSKRDYHVGNVSGAFRDGNEHPCPRPLDTVTHLVALTEGVIIDPFMGSGTTLRAAKDLGRKCIGIEIEEKYAEIAARRLQQEVLSL